MNRANNSGYFCGTSPLKEKEIKFRGILTPYCKTDITRPYVWGCMNVCVKLRERTHEAMRTYVFTHPAKRASKRR